MKFNLAALAPDGRANVFVGKRQNEIFIRAVGAVPTMLEGNPNPSRLWLDGDTGALVALWGHPEGRWLRARVGHDQSITLEARNHSFQGVTAVAVTEADLDEIAQGKTPDSVYALALGAASQGTSN